MRSAAFIQRVVAHRYFAAIALALMVLASATIYALVAAQQSIPDLLPDEMYYGKLAQNWAYGRGFQWRGSNFGLPPLWPLVLSVAWRGQSAPEGYAVAKTLGALVISTTAVPVWFMARAVVGPRLALVPAVLAIAGAWMQVSDFIASEALAYPLATASLAMTVAAVRDTRMRWIAGSLAFAALAAATRTQMLVLPVILVLALLFDVLRQPMGARRARIAQRPIGLWLGLIVAVTTGLSAFVINPHLTNYEVLAHHASFGQTVTATFRQAVEAFALLAFVPIVALGALMSRASNWRDDRVGPVLATTLAAAIVIFPLVGRFTAGVVHGVPIDRYSMYIAPLLMTALVIAPGRIRKRDAILCAVLIAGLCIAAPDLRTSQDQYALFGIRNAWSDLGVTGSGQNIGFVAIALVVSLGSALALTARQRRNAGLALAVGLFASVALLQSVESRSAEHAIAAKNRRTLLPRDLNWVDKYATARVGILDVAKNLGIRSNSASYTEFFNRKIDAVYSTVARDDRACDVDIGAGGVLRHGDPECTTWPRNWLLTSGPVTLTLRRQKVLHATSAGGILVATPASTPRIRSLVAPPCFQQFCTGQFWLTLYLDKPSTVAVKFSPGTTDHRVALGGSKIQVLPAGEPATLRFKLGAGKQEGTLPVDWTDPDGAPKLASVTVTSGSKTFRAY